MYLEGEKLWAIKIYFFSLNICSQILLFIMVLPTAVIIVEF